VHLVARPPKRKDTARNKTRSYYKDHPSILRRKDKVENRKEAVLE
jgi:hypothetical protein